MLGNLAINFPHDVPTSIRAQAQETFEGEVQVAHLAQDAIGLVRAAARLISTVAPHSTSISQRVQIGISIADPSGGHVSRYFDGHAQEILSLMPVHFFPSSESAT